MQIEAYKMPYDKSGKVAASKWIAYILRPEETGLLCPTAIMTDPRFEKGIADLRAKQIDEFQTTVSPKSLEFWKTREIPEDDPKMTPKERKTYERQRQQRNRILAQEENVDDAGPIGYIRNTASNTRVHKLVHDMMLSQKYNLTGGVAAGKMIQHQFDQAILTDPEAVEKVIAAMKAVRDCFPPNMPVVLSFHLGQPKKDPETGRVLRDPVTGDKIYENPHIHGWFYDREWDLNKSEWGEINPLTSTKQGLVDLHKLVDSAVRRTTGSNFGDRKRSLDPDRPKREIFTKRERYWTLKFKGEHKEDEFLSGEFLKTIGNDYEREAMRQFIVQRRYDVAKRRAAEALKQEKQAHREDLEKLMITDKVPRQERRVTYQDIEEMAILMEAASNPSPELQKMYAQPEVKSGASAFKPIAGYYRTKQFHTKLAPTITSLYDGFDDAEKAEEVKSIRASISKIDDRLANAELSETQRTNLEFTRDFEIKSLKYMKAQLPPSQPKPAIKSATQPKPKIEPVKTEKLPPSSNKALKL